MKKLLIILLLASCSKEKTDNYIIKFTNNATKNNDTIFNPNLISEVFIQIPQQTEIYTTIITINNKQYKYPLSISQKTNVARNAIYTPQQHTKISFFVTHNQDISETRYAYIK